MAEFTYHLDSAVATQAFDTAAQLTNMQQSISSGVLDSLPQQLDAKINALVQQEVSRHIASKLEQASTQQQSRTAGKPSRFMCTCVIHLYCNAQTPICTNTTSCAQSQDDDSVGLHHGIPASHHVALS